MASVSCEPQVTITKFVLGLAMLSEKQTSTHASKLISRFSITKLSQSTRLVLLIVISTEVYGKIKIQSVPSFLASHLSLKILPDHDQHQIHSLDSIKPPCLYCNRLFQPHTGSRLIPFKKPQGSKYKSPVILA